MPIYEFFCPNNNRIYSFFARSLAHVGKTPRCPDQPKFRMERVMSSFAVTGRAKEKPDLPTGPDPGEERMDAMMAEMEQDMVGMDENNPDPRLMASMLRKMTSLSSQKVPAEMEEVIARMEKGEDPEKLDEEFGEALENFDLDGPGGEGSEEVKARLRALRRRPRRDPTLYEMSDYVD